MAEPKERRWAWVVPWGGAGLAGSFSESLPDALGSPFRAVGLFFAFGLLLGWAWDRLYARPLVDRLAGFAICACAVMALIFVISIMDPKGLSADGTALGSGVAWGGVLTALVLVEYRRTSPPAL